MRRFSKSLIAVMMIGAFAACTAEVEDPGEAPDIDVQGGEAPDIDVDPADVDITTDTQTIVTPDIDVNAQPDADEP
jgi:hypothetical protein